MGKLVSVIIPTYKRPDVLSRAIDSVLAQTYRNIEILVVDDNDPTFPERAETEKVMEKYKDNVRVKYLRHEHNKNGSAARNTGWRASGGDYIMFLDDDDEFFPEKVESQLKCLESKDETYGACYSYYVRKNSEGKITVKCGENREGNLYAEELKRNLFVHAGSNLMVRRQVIEELDGFDESFLRNQDVEFMVRLLKNYKLAYSPVPGLIVYIHKGGENSTFEGATERFLSKFGTYIDELPDKEKKSVYKMINLQLFRHRLSCSGKRGKAVKMIMSGEVNLFSAARYFCHLINRKITHKAYGYKG